MATKQPRSFANNSLYSNLMLFAGILFGAAEYSLLVNGFQWQRIEITAFLLGSVAVLLTFLAKFNSHASRNEPMSALARGKWHIFVDYLNAVALTSVFSILTFIIASGEAIVDQSYNLTAPTFILLANGVLFVVTTFCYSQLAREERKTGGLLPGKE